jgi:hypothetical protein
MLIIKLRITLTLCFLAAILCYAQPVWEQWRATYSGPGIIDMVKSMCIDSSGNVYVTGQSDNIGNNSKAYATVKYNTSGAQQWVARYSDYPNRLAFPYSITVDRFGNSYVTGTAPVSSNGPSKYTTLKYNQVGVQVWVKIYYGEYYQAVNDPYSITSDHDANIYVTGGCFFLGTSYDYVTIKYDSSGSEQWLARYISPGMDWAKKVVVDDISNVCVTGNCFNDTTFEDIVTVKYNSSGIQQWAARYNGPGDSTDIPYDLKVDNSGNVYVTGKSWGGYSSTQFDYITIKYNQSGVQQWAERYGGTSNWTTDEAYSLAVDNSGNVYITGYNNWATNNLDCATIKYNSSGNLQWIQIYDYNSSIDYGISLTLDKLNNIYVLAQSHDEIPAHFATIKYSPAGEQLWVIRTYPPGAQSPLAIAVDSSCGVYVTGGESGDYLTIKYNQIVGVNPVSNEVPEDFRLYQNYPNPFNPVTKINFDLPARSHVELNVYDAAGRLVSNILTGDMEAGKYTADFNALNLASGVYYYELNVKIELKGMFREVKKLVVLK